MSLNDSGHAAVNKKVTLMDKDLSRFAVRSVLGGVYLTLGTAFAAVVGQAVDKHAPGLGPVVFAFLFGLGLYYIVTLGADLATGNMMYASFGAAKKQISWAKAFKLMLITTIFNLVGALLIGLVMGVSAKFAHVDPQHLVSTLSAGKLVKSPLQMIVEGMAANFVVNMGIVGSLFAKSVTDKFMVILPAVAIFVGLGLEHVIANFSLFSLTLFASDPMIPEMTLANVALNWSLVWVGNFLGGGLLVGALYAWLNSGNEAYRD